MAAAVEISSNSLAVNAPKGLPNDGTGPCHPVDFRHDRRSCLLFLTLDNRRHQDRPLARAVQRRPQEALCPSPGVDRENQHHRGRP